MSAHWGGECLEVPTPARSRAAPERQRHSFGAAHSLRCFFGGGFRGVGGPFCSFPKDAFAKGSHGAAPCRDGARNPAPPGGLGQLRGRGQPGFWAMIYTRTHTHTHIYIYIYIYISVYVCVCTHTYIYFCFIFLFMYFVYFVLISISIIPFLVWRGGGGGGLWR